MTAVANAPLPVRRSALNDRQRRALLGALVATGNATQADRTVLWEPTWTNEFLVEDALIALDEVRTTGEGDRRAAWLALADALAKIADLPNITAELVEALLPLTPTEVES